MSWLKSCHDEVWFHQDPGKASVSVRVIKHISCWLISDRKVKHIIQSPLQQLENLITFLFYAILKSEHVSLLKVNKQFILCLKKSDKMNSLSKKKKIGSPVWLLMATCAITDGDALTAFRFEKYRVHTAEQKLFGRRQPTLWTFK